jgi:iron complex outermembrane receptor protein
LYKRKLLAATAMFGLIAYGLQATAQTAATAPAKAASAPAATKGKHRSVMEEVVVTARRRSESLQKVPIAVTVFSQADLGRKNVSLFSDLAVQTPSLSATTNSAGHNETILTLRGQGQTAEGGEAAVVAYFAQVPTSSAGPGEFFDLQSLQILKGPQGTLFGRNTTGGALLLEPARPTNKLEGYLDTQFGDYGLHRFQGALNVPVVNDKLSIRVAFDTNDRDGYTRDVANNVNLDDEHYTAWRVGIKFNPNADFQNYLVVNGYESSENGPGISLVNVNPATPAAFLFPQLFTELAEQQARGPRTTAHFLSDQYDRTRTFDVTDIASYEISPDSTIKDIVGYRHFHQQIAYQDDGSDAPVVAQLPSPFQGAGSAGPPSTDLLTEELQTLNKSFDNRLNWVAGLYAEYGQSNVSQPTDVVEEFAFPANPNPDLIIRNRRLERSFAAYGQGTLDLSDWVLHGLKFTGGLRYTRDFRDLGRQQYTAPLYSYAYGGIANCNLPQPEAGPNCYISNGAHFHAVTYNLSLDYQALPSTLVYVAHRRGYKSGGFNNTSIDLGGGLYQPEYLSDVEVGVKYNGRVGPSLFRFNADVYRGDYSNIQVNDVQASSTGNVVESTNNAASGLVQGAEAEATLFPIDDVQLTSFFSYTDAHYTKYISDGIDISHNPFPSVPKFKFGVSATYTLPVGDSDGSIVLFGNYAFTSPYYPQVDPVPDQLDPFAKTKTYALLDLRADWKSVLGSQFDLGLFITNVTNETYRSFYFNTYSTPLGIGAAVYGPPRMFGGGIHFHFG